MTLDPRPSTLDPRPSTNVEFDLPAINRQLTELGRRGTGVLRVVMPAEIVITLAVDRIGPEGYQALASLGGEAWLEEPEEPDERIRQMHDAVKCRLRWRRGCRWQEDGGRGEPGHGDFSEAALTRLDAYLDWIMDRLTGGARARRGRSSAAHVRPSHVDAAARRLLDPCPVFDDENDQVARPRSKGSRGGESRAEG